MKNLLLLLIILSFSACTQKKTKTVKNSFVLANVDIKRDSIYNAKSIPCNCPEPYKNADSQIKIDYENGQYIKFCSSDYSDVKQTTSDFSIYNSSDSIILEGSAPSEFKIVSLAAPLKIIQSSIIKTDESNDWEKKPVLEHEIVFFNNKFQVQESFVFQPPKMNKSEMDSILIKYNLQPKLNQELENVDAPIASEGQLMDLFICAVNNNIDCIKALDNLPTYFMVDGASAELYYELHGILQVYKKLKNLY